MPIDPLTCNLATPSNARRHILDKINEMITMNNAMLTLLNEVLERDYLTREDILPIVDRSPSVLVVTFSKNNDDILCDTSLDDILGALDAGRHVVGMWKPYSKVECNPVNLLYYYIDPEGTNSQAIFGGNSFLGGNIFYKTTSIFTNF